MDQTGDPYEKLGAFETFAHAGECRQAFGAAIDFLHILQFRYLNASLAPPGYTGHLHLPHAALCERFAAAWMRLLLDARLDLGSAPLVELMRQQHLLHELAHGTTAGNFDTALTALQQRTGGRYDLDGLIRLLLLWVPGSRVPLDWAQLHPYLPELVTAVAIAAVGGQVNATPEAHRARESAIAFLNSGVPQASDVRRLGLSNVVHYAWMFCSYAVSPEKHRCKRLLNALIEQTTAGGLPGPMPAVASSGGRPVMIVPLESFASSHAMYRCYAPVLESCRRNFFIVGVSLAGNVDAKARQLFDVFHAIDEECLRNGVLDTAAVERLIRAYEPALVFYPSIGMQMQTLLLANRRLAPVQAMTYGHPATSESRYIDYGLTEKQWIVDESRFSEKMIGLPPGTLRYVLHAEAKLPAVRRRDDVLRVAVPSVVQKWTAPFLETLAWVRARVGPRVEFHFFSGVSGYSYAAACHAAWRALPAATIHPALTYPQYMAALARCDVHAATFPFGGTNSVFDSLTSGLPVVCLRAMEIHGAQEEDFLQRAGLPDWLAAADAAAYADVLVRLVEEPELLATLQAQLADSATVRDRFVRGGDPDAFADALHDIATRGVQSR